MSVSNHASAFGNLVWACLWLFNIFIAFRYTDFVFSCMKALLGLQFLLNRARALQENESKFPLSGEQFTSSSLSSVASTLDMHTFVYCQCYCF